MAAAPGEPGNPGIGEFAGAEPTRDLAAWRWLWEGDVAFPPARRPGLFGLLRGWAVRLLRPWARLATRDLWERQRIYNIVLLEHLAALDERYGWVANDLGGARGDLDSHARRIEMLEGSRQADWTFVLRHNDALFARVDQKLDRYRGEARRLWGDLGAALVELEAARPESVAALGQAREEYVYRELEHYHRGTPEELENRFTPHLEALRGRRRVLDLGCGRGEALEILGRHGVGARGVDGNARMVEACRERGLEAEQGDLFDTLKALEPGSVDGLLSLHVIEHLPPDQLDRLARLAWRALEPGGILILETPNPLSLVVASRDFWIDPTHRRPVHPATLSLLLETAGFEDLEVHPLHPFPAGDRLPEVNVRDLPDSLLPLADAVNALRDHLDSLLYGQRDYALLARKPAV